MRYGDVRSPREATCPSIASLDHQGRRMSSSSSSIPPDKLSRLLGASAARTLVEDDFEMAVVTFGGAYAVLTCVARQAAECHCWVAPREIICSRRSPAAVVILNLLICFSLHTRPHRAAV